MDHECWCKGHWEGWVRVGEKSQDPLRETKIAPLALDYESARTHLDTIKRQCLASINQSINQSIVYLPT